MARSIWKGAISFGLVNVPVGLYSAEKRDELRFNQLDRRTMSRVREKRVDEKTGGEVPYEEIVKGYDTGGGQYVVLTDEEIKAANPKATQTVDIVGFVAVDEIDVTYFERPYYLAPIGSGKKGYALLRAVLRDTGRAAIARVVIRTRGYLCAIVARDDVLVLETLRYAYELRDPGELDVPEDDLDALGVSKPEAAMAQQLIEAMTTRWDPEAYRDEYREDLLRVIHEKESTGHVEAVAAGAPEGGGQVVDIMALLKRSVDEVRRAGGEDDAETTGASAVEPPVADEEETGGRAGGKAKPKRGKGGGRRKAA